ncbi:MAG: HU family DNA-binding protein [Paracoccaceae bacterium]
MPTKTTTAKPAAKTGMKAGAAKAGPAKAGARPVGKAMVDVAAAAPLDTVVAVEGEAKVVGAGLRLKDLVDRVVAATGGKKKGVKEIVEATLTQMGDALQRGETLHLPNFGKARVAKAGTVGGGAMTVKLRRGTGEGAKGKGSAAMSSEDKDALADESDQG